MDIFTQNYQAVVNRGLITKKTTDREFCCKANEELSEVHKALYNFENNRENNLDEEITDLANVCLNWLIFRGKNPEEMLKIILEKNEKRAIK